MSLSCRFAVHTDIGTRKNTNQDSFCFREAVTDSGTVLMAAVCDGMGGLEKGELASATIVAEFSEWFERELPRQLAYENSHDDIRRMWSRMIDELNRRIANYGRNNNIQLGSTLTVMLLLEDGWYLIGHVGDSRVYRITDAGMEILTEDQTLVAYEVRQGKLTPEQAETDSRRNILLQCVGASNIVEPQFVEGYAAQGECFMLCSDGFRRVISPQEIFAAFSPQSNPDEATMQNNVVSMIELDKARGETDNITVALLKLE